MIVTGFAAVAFDLFETLVTEFDPQWRPAPTAAEELGVPADRFNDVWRCSRLGVSPEHVAFVGDGGSDELAGARGTGMTPYWARWFLDQWPVRYAADRRERLRGYPTLTTPGELLHAFRTQGC